MSEINSIVLDNEYVKITGVAEDNDIIIAVQYDGNKHKRLCIILDCDGYLQVFEPTPQGLASALKQLAIADKETLVPAADYLV